MLFGVGLDALMLLLVSGAAAALLAIHLLRKRNRKIWRELFLARQNLGALEKRVVCAHKEAVCAGVRKSCRLPLSLPSQNGEEILLWNYFGRKQAGFFVEVGAYDGFGFSNSYFFEAMGWTGVLVEPVPEFFEACRARRPFSQVIHAVAGDGACKDAAAVAVASGPVGIGTLSYTGQNPRQLARIEREGGRVRVVAVPRLSLDEILVGHEGEIDFVSIDVEGAEIDVLHGFDLGRYQPSVLVIEDNSGGTDASVASWLRERGYEERFRCEQNVFYARHEDIRTFGWALEAVSPERGTLAPELRL